VTGSPRIRTEPDRSTRRGEWRASGNQPPLTRLDVAGLLVAGLGTAILVAIAIASASGHHGHLGGVTIARMLIALAALLINGAHVVGILLFESVDYHGPFQKLFARLSLTGTPIAICVSLAIGLL
jgi:hypothetical protein